MNQILYTKFENYNSKDNYENHLSKRVFKTQLLISIIAILIIVSLFAFYYYNLLQKEKLSNNLINNYEISKLYATPNKSSSDSNLIAGLIEIPSINLSYPIFSKLDNELLKVSPCIVYGKMPPDFSNLCIAGHNYNNDKFFSKINLLNLKSEINIYDNIGKKFTYFVYDNYEVKDNDLSPIFKYDLDSCILTLITCNNFNNNRVIIKAKLEAPD